MSKSFGTVPLEPPRISALTGLAPRFAGLLTRLAERMADQGKPVDIYETLRTDARQQFLWGFGRDYDDGRGVVTHSRDADETWHFFGLAADIIHPTFAWAAPVSFWSALRETAEALGLRSGSDWDMNNLTPEHFADAPHVQWGPPMRRSPSPRAARLLAKGGLRAVWAEVGAI
jgi:hypothetical protein